MNCQPKKRHIKVPQESLLYPIHIDNKKQNEKFLFKCVTRPDLSGVPFKLFRVKDMKITTL